MCDGQIYFLYSRGSKLLRGSLTINDEYNWKSDEIHHIVFLVLVLVLVITIPPVWGIRLLFPVIPPEEPVRLRIHLLVLHLECRLAGLFRPCRGLRLRHFWQSRCLVSAVLVYKVLDNAVRALELHRLLIPKGMSLLRWELRVPSVQDVAVFFGFPVCVRAPAPHVVKVLFEGIDLELIPLHRFRLLRGLYSWVAGGIKGIQGGVVLR